MEPKAAFTLLDRLRANIADFGKSMDKHLEKCTIKRRIDRPIPGVIVLLPPYYWERNDPTELVREMKLRQELCDWYESFELLFSESGDRLSKEVTELKGHLSNWVERDHSYYVPSNIHEGRAEFQAQLKVANILLDSLSENAETKVILVPDTNSLCIEPDLGAYNKIAGTETYEIKLMPTVLGELDKLKIAHHNPEFRKKAEKAIQRIKGLRNQGNIVKGVTINKSIKVMAIAKEPNFGRTLSWLDSNNLDDRIIAGVLEVQREEPAGTVILVTGDINLQNKAAAANLPFSEPPIILEGV